MGANRPREQQSPVPRKTLKFREQTSSRRQQLGRRRRIRCQNPINFQYLTSTGDFSGEHTIFRQVSTLLEPNNDCQILSDFFTSRSDNTPRQGFDFETPSTFSHHYCCVFFLTSSHAYKTRTQHQQITNTTLTTFQSRTHTNQTPLEKKITFFLQTLGPRPDSFRVLFSGVKKFVTIFKMLPN